MYTLFQTKMAKSIPYLRLEMHKNDTLWGGVCLCGLCKGVPPFPPPRALVPVQSDVWCRPLDGRYVVGKGGQYAVGREGNYSRVYRNLHIARRKAL